MLEGGKIDGRQAVYLCITFVIATALLSLPGIVAAHAKQDAWISSLLATMIGLAVAGIVVKLGSLFPQQTLVEFTEEILGTWLGKLLGLTYLLFFLYIAAFMLRETSSFLNEIFLPKTPLIAIAIIIALLGAYTIKHGLEVLARVNQIFLPVIVASVIFIFLLLIPEMDPKRLAPVLEAGPQDIARGSLVPAAWIGEIFALTMVVPFLLKKRELGEIVLKSVLAVGTVFLLIIIGCIATFDSIIEFMIYPVLNASRIINVSEFIDRLEPIIMVIWVTGGFVKVTFFYYIIVLGSAQWLRLKSYRPLTLPLGVILVSLSILVGDNILEILHFLSGPFPFFALSFELLIPLLLLAIALVRKRWK